MRERPLAGHGLGKRLTYTTEDPRYIEMNGTDQVTTYAFEWGWHDLFIKFGALGVLVMLWILWSVFAPLVTLTKTDPARRWLWAGLAVSVIALALAHTFSPYLNHPLGWGTLAFIALLLPPRAQKPLTVPSITLSPLLMRPAVGPPMAYRYDD